MKKQTEIFNNYLGLFEKSVLTPYKYNSKERSVWRDDNSIYTNSYWSQLLGIELGIDLADLRDGRYFIILTMQSEEVGVHQQKKYFALLNYIREHGLTDFRCISEPGEDFALFAKHFFENLQSACETYLHDQLMGSSFEEHDPWMGR